MAEGTRSSAVPFEANHSSPMVRAVIWSDIQFVGSSTAAIVPYGQPFGSLSLKQSIRLGKVSQIEFQMHEHFDQRARRIFSQIND